MLFLRSEEGFVLKKKDWLFIGFVVVSCLLLYSTTYFTRQYDNVYSILPYSLYLFTLPIALLAGLYRNDRKWLRRTAYGICTALLVVGLGTFFFFLPDYTAEKAYAIVTADPEFSDGEVIHTGAAYLDNSNPNPLYRGGYNFRFESESRKGSIQFDMATGEYHFYAMETD